MENMGHSHEEQTGLPSGHQFLAAKGPSQEGVLPPILSWGFIQGKKFHSEICYSVPILCLMT